MITKPLPDFIEELRTTISDRAELNRLIRKVESTDELYEFAIEDAIDDFNDMWYPLSAVTYDTFPSKGLLKQGVIIQLLIDNSILHMRNSLQYNSGGITVNTFDKAPEYQRWALQYQQQYLEKIRKIKVETNFNNCWGGVSSDF